MDNEILEDVKVKYLKKNEILFSRNSICLQELISLIRNEKHRTLVKWAFMCSEQAVKTLKEHYPNEKIFEEAIYLCKEWAKGNIKMPIAKKALLKVHSFAKSIDNPVDIALCHAVGQACSTVHVETHAIGLPIYELSAIVKKYGINSCSEPILKRIEEYIANLRYCANNMDKDNESWAKFLNDSKKINKEQLLFDKINTNDY